LRAQACMAGHGMAMQQTTRRRRFPVGRYDDNQITIDGRTDIAFTEDVGKRFEAYGFAAPELPCRCGIPCRRGIP
jgi:hypothetical protein